MPITEEQRIERRNHIGSSDVPAILGLSRFGTASEVYLEKTCQLDDIKGSESIDAGNYLEPGILRWASDQLGVSIEENVHRESAKHNLHASNLDALIVGSRSAIEAKSVGNTSDYIDTVDDWLDPPDADSVPDYVQAQTQHQMFCADLDLVYVAAFIRGRGFCLYEVLRDEAAIQIIVRESENWWYKHVAQRIPPADSTPSLDVLKRVRRAAKTFKTVEAEMAVRYMDACEFYKHVEKTRDGHKAKFLAAIGDAEAADWGDEEYVFTFLEQSKAGLDADLLKIEHPDIYNKYLKKSTCRVLRKSNRSNIDEFAIKVG